MFNRRGFIARVAATVLAGVGLRGQRPSASNSDTPVPPLPIEALPLVYKNDRIIGYAMEYKATDDPDREILIDPNPVFICDDGTTFEIVGFYELAAMREHETR